MQTVLDVLVAARKLIEKPENWTQLAIALDRRGEYVDPCSPAATCFCMLGAIERSADDYDVRFPTRLALREIVGSSIAGFNDTHTHAEVLAAFDCAIAKRAKVSA